MSRNGQNGKSALDERVILYLKNILDTHNRLVKLFRQIGSEITTHGDAEYSLRLLDRRSADGRLNSQTNASEIAILVPGSLEKLAGERDIIVHSKSQGLQRISELHVLYLPLQYPLIYMRGQDGFRKGILHNKTEKTKEKKDRFVTMLEFIIYYLHERPFQSPHLMFCRRLFQQWLVDVFTMVESYRLNFFRAKQERWRFGTYQALDDAFNKGDTSGANVGKRIRLPPSFVGGPRFLMQNYHDAMTICRFYGYPSLFITFTCNPKWLEIDRYIKDRGLTNSDRPEIQCRIFYAKLKLLMDDITKKHIFGKDQAAVYTIEYQGRGLPHAHILIWLANIPTEVNIGFIDKHILAEIPDKETDPAYYDAVNELMMHGPCGEANKAMACTVNGVCQRHFPKRWSETTCIDQDGYVIYRRRNDGRTVSRKEIDLDNRFVVPHNRFLLLKYRAHINVEWCNRSRSIKYLFKYVHKGDDHATLAFYKASDTGQPIDEIKLFIDCRYVSSTEAAWRLYSFETHFRNPSVLRMGFHLEDYKPLLFQDDSVPEEVLKRARERDTMLEAWFTANKNLEGVQHLTYPELPIYLTWHPLEGEWTIRRTKTTQIGRLYYVYPGQGELYYQRILLNYVKGCKCFADIRKYEGRTYDTYKEACLARGLLDDENEFVLAIEEASQWGGGFKLRTLFCDFLINCNVSEPDKLFLKVFNHLSEDVLYRYRKRMKRNDLNLTEEQIKNLCLIDIEKELQTRNKKLEDFANMPVPDYGFINTSTNQLLAEEKAYDMEQLEKLHNELSSKLNSEQRVVYETITQRVYSRKPGLFFLYGYGGTGKTFVWNTLSAAVRSKGFIVLNVASSGIASLLLPGGRTAHSRFSIPIDIHDHSTCNIDIDGDVAELHRETSLIIWDEAPMVHRNCFEALDKTLRDIMKKVDRRREFLPFGGIVVVFGGDFRQILPVIPKGTREDIVRATINSSHIWKDVTVLKLTKNMRLSSLSSLNSDAQSLSDFSAWLTSVGDGTLGGLHDGEVEIDIPDEYLIKESSDHIKSIVDSTYPDFENHIGDVSYLHGRAILAPTLEDVDKINEYMVSLHKTEETVYLSADSLSVLDRGSSIVESMQSVEFLNTIKCSGLPNHELKLKTNVPVMLMRNTNPTAGLCNGTRLMIKKLGKYVIEAEVLSGRNRGQTVWIGRMTLTPNDPRLPFKFQRRQFPLIRSYAMTINKSQGQSLDVVGIYLPKGVFTHGQFYVAISRVTNKAGLKLLIVDQEGNLKKTTPNVVYREVFNNV